MKKIIYLFLIIIFIPNCSINKVVKNHGTNFIDKKEKKLFINKSNKNDIIALLGPPSTKSMFDNDLWIYIERKNSKKSLITLGANKILTNNILVLEIDSKGLLAKKNLYQLDKMNNIDFSEDTTTMTYSKNSFVYDFLNSLRQKVDSKR